MNFKEYVKQAESSLSGLGYKKVDDFYAHGVMVIKLVDGQGMAIRLEIGEESDVFDEVEEGMGEEDEV